MSVASGHTVIYCADPSQDTIYEITAIGGAQALFTNRNKPVQTAIDESASILFWVEFDSGL